MLLFCLACMLLRSRVLTGFYFLALLLVRNRLVLFVLAERAQKSAASFSVEAFRLAFSLCFVSHHFQPTGTFSDYE